MSVVTRFPPSPTGDLHIGSIRTALFNWLYARRYGGKFILRIEDTDRARSSQQAVDIILAGMEWLGLDYDEGPYYQTQRFDRYGEVVEQLLAQDKAYRCYCSKERLETLRADQMARKLKPRYDGHCRSLGNVPTEGVAPVVRFRTPLDGAVVIADKVHGRITTSNTQLDDLVIARSDGSPTYHLTVVVDDIDMGVTHIIRGDDHINNTPRQVHILEALGADRPIYAHVPMINGSDGKKLSKRHGAVSVLEYRAQGFLAGALTNYLVRLGWAHGDQEIFTRDELKNAFDFGGLNKSAATFDLDKFLWLNQQYLQNLAPAELVALANPFFEVAKVQLDDGPDVAAAVEAQRTRAKTLIEIAEQSHMFYGDLIRDKDAAKKHLRPAVASVLQKIREKFVAVETWSGAALKDIVEQTAIESNMKMGKVAQPLRVAVTGSSASPSIDITLELLGRKRCLERLDGALVYIAERAAT